MKFIKYLSVTVALMTGAVSTGCSDSDDWKPGPQDTEVGVSAYFTKPSATSYIFGSDYDAEDMTITVPISREKTTDEATVSINLTADADGFTAPSSVTFAAGQASTSFTIDCSGIAKGEKYNVTVSLPADQTYTYGPGMHELTFSAIKADWKVISEKARYLYSDFNYDPIFPTTYGKLYQLEGTYMFKLDDFFGSGLDITFECDTPEATVMMPLQNANFDDVADYDKEDLGWYLYDEANSSWPTWTPGDAAGYPAITYLLFYGILDYNYMEMIYNKDTLYGYIGLTVGIDTDDDNFQWGSFQVDFTLEYNPFVY